MRLLDHVMHPFSRIQWVSKPVKDKWEKKFNKAQQFFKIMETQSVIQGLRSATTTHIAPQELDKKIQEYNMHGLVFLPIQKVGLYNGRSNYHPPVIKGRPWTYYGVLADSIEHAQEFAYASDAMDHRRIGRLLGFPECCISFFLDHFPKKYVDPIWQQAENASNEFIVKKEEKLIRLKNLPWELNNFVKSFSVMTGFQCICSYNCQNSLMIAREWVDLAKSINIEGVHDLEQILRMPMEWESGRGIAYIRTPLFKAAYNSNFSEEIFVVQREGDFYPEDGAKGIGFPFNEEVYIKFKNALGREA